MDLHFGFREAQIRAQIRHKDLWMGIRPYVAESSPDARTAARSGPAPAAARSGPARTARRAPAPPAARPAPPAARSGRHGTWCVGGDGGESNSPSRTLRRDPLRACPMIYRRPPERTSAPCRAVQSRSPRSGLTPDYVTLVRIAASLHDASTTREAEAASTLTLLPKQRERESTGGCQVLLFAT